MRPLRPLASRPGVRALLRVPRGRDGSVPPGALQGLHCGEPARDARGGLSPHHGPRGQRDRVDADPAHDLAREALLHLLRPRRVPRAAPGSARLDRQVQGTVRPGLGQAPRGDARAAEEARRRSGRRQADATPRGDPGVGLVPGRSEAALLAHDGGLRGLPCPHRQRDRPCLRRDRENGRPRQHPRPLHRGRQRGERRRHVRGNAQRGQALQRRPRGREEQPRGDRRARRPPPPQPLPDGLGLGGRHSVPVDEAGRLALRRDAKPARRLVAPEDQGQGGPPDPVPPRDRRRAHDPRGGRDPRARRRQRRASEADRGCQHGLHLRRRRGSLGAPHAVLRDVREPRALPRRLDRGRAARSPLGSARDRQLRGRPVGALLHRQGLQRGRRPRGEGAREAPGAPGPLLGRGGEARRASARRPEDGALRREPPPGSDGRPLERDVLSRRRAYPRVVLPEHEGKGAQDHGRGRDPGPRHRGRAPELRLPDGGLRAPRAGGEARLPLQLRR